MHVEQMHMHQSGIDSSLKETHTYLDKLYDEITRTLEKIGSREKYLNTQLEQQLVEFRTMQDQLAETRERYRQGSGGVTERTRTLAEVGTLVGVRLSRERTRTLAEVGTVVSGGDASCGASQLGFEL